MDLSYDKVFAYLTGLHGLKSLGTHQNNFDPKTRLAIIHNIKQLEAAQTYFQSMMKELVEASPEASIIDDNGNTVLKIDHPVTQEFMKETTFVDVRRLDFSKINTDETQISIDAIGLLYDILDNVKLENEQE